MSVYINILENKYPQYYGDIQLANPAWDGDIDNLPDGWAIVRVLDWDGIVEGENILEPDFPQLIDGEWVQDWIIRPLTPEEIETKYAPQSAKAKLIALGLSEVEIQALAMGLVR